MDKTDKLIPIPSRYDVLQALIEQTVNATLDKHPFKKQLEDIQKTVYGNEDGLTYRMQKLELLEKAETSGRRKIWSFAFGVISGISGAILTIITAGIIYWLGWK